MANVLDFIAPALDVGAAVSKGVGSAYTAQGADLLADAALAKGQRLKQASEFEAQQLETNAGQSVAASQRVAADQRLQSEYLASKAIAVAAASGGTATDPTVINVVSKIAGIGALNATMALYNGEEQARQQRAQAYATRFAGDTAVIDSRTAADAYHLKASAARVAGVGSAIGDAATLFSKYGKDLFKGIGVGGSGAAGAAVPMAGPASTDG
jgi:hypothetical protein